MARRSLAAALLAALALVAAGCGGGEDGYSAEVEESFVSECVKAATPSEGQSLTDEQAQEYCGCTYDDIEANVPYEEFEEYDTKAREDPSTPLPPKMNEAAERCAEKIVPES